MRTITVSRQAMSDYLESQGIGPDVTTVDDEWSSILAAGQNLHTLLSRPVPSHLGVEKITAKVVGYLDDSSEAEFYSMTGPKNVSREGNDMVVTNARTRMVIVDFFTEADTRGPGDILFLA